MEVSKYLNKYIILQNYTYKYLNWPLFYCFKGCIWRIGLASILDELYIIQLFFYLYFVYLGLKLNKVLYKEKQNLFPSYWHGGYKWKDEVEYHWFVYGSWRFTKCFDLLSICIYVLINMSDFVWWWLGLCVVFMWF